MNQSIQKKGWWDSLTPGEKKILIGICVLLGIAIVSLVITVLVKKDTGSILGVVKNFKVSSFV